MSNAIPNNPFIYDESNPLDFPENAWAFVMEVCGQVSDGVQKSMMIQVQSAMLWTNISSWIQTVQIDTVKSILEGTYVGWMDNYNKNNDPAIMVAPGDDPPDSDAINTNSALSAEANSFFGAQTSIASSAMSMATAELKMASQAEKKLFSFMSTICSGMDYLSTLLG